MAVGAIGSALAPNLAVLIVARIVQGFGGASIAVLATALVSILCAGTTRDAALGRLAGVTATISALDAALGGGPADVAGVAVAFGVLVALPAAGLTLLVRSARRSPTPA